MGLNNVKSALRYSFASKKPSLSTAIADGDFAMADYLLEKHAATIDAFSLGYALALLAEGKETRCTEKIYAHPEAKNIAPIMLSSCLNSAARSHKVDMVKKLLSLPQISCLTKSDWSGILFESLPKGDPQKKILEPRPFEDKDGHPEILKMVRAAINKKPELKL